MKPVEDVVACVYDYGTFLNVAEKLAETMKAVYYYSPWETEYQDVRNCITGCGLDKVKRLDEPLDPVVLEHIDLFVFPDIGFGSLQRHLRSLGKAVWGHMGADILETQRDHFLDVLEDLGLPTIHSEPLVGMSALVAYLKKHENKWVKLNRFRFNMETWKHKDYAQSERKLDSLAVIFGGAKERITFVVQDDIESDLEIGYDGWCIDGVFPFQSFQGYEKKNDLYLGALLSDVDLPEEIKTVNEAMSPVLEEYGYRCWWATEIRVADGTPYFIDPTPRMPGLTAEHQLETCANLADVIWHGANGVVLQPEFLWRFAAEATLNFDKLTGQDPTIRDEWKSLAIPKEVARWVKMMDYCVLDGVHHFSSRTTDEVGVVLGVGDSIEEAISHLKENLEGLKELPVSAEIAGFADLLEEINDAQSQGLHFAEKVPKPETMLNGSASG